MDLTLPCFRSSLRDGFALRRMAQSSLTWPFSLACSWNQYCPQKADQGPSTSEKSQVKGREEPGKTLMRERHCGTATWSLRSSCERSLSIRGRELQSRVSRTDARSHGTRFPSQKICCVTLGWSLHLSESRSLLYKTGKIIPTLQMAQCRWSKTSWVTEVLSSERGWGAVPIDFTLE